LRVEPNPPAACAVPPLLQPTVGLADNACGASLVWAQLMNENEVAELMKINPRAWGMITNRPPERYLDWMFGLGKKP
jgi:hypothetical protein